MPNKVISDEVCDLAKKAGQAATMYHSSNTARLIEFITHFTVKKKYEEEVH